VRGTAWQPPHRGDCRGASHSAHLQCAARSAAQVSLRGLSYGASQIQGEETRAPHPCRHCEPSRPWRSAPWGRPPLAPCRGRRGVETDPGEGRRGNPLNGALDAPPSPRRNSHTVGAQRRCALTNNFVFWGGLPGPRSLMTGVSSGAALRGAAWRAPRECDCRRSLWVSARTGSMPVEGRGLLAPPARRVASLRGWARGVDAGGRECDARATGRLAPR